MNITMQLLDVDYFMNGNNPVIRLFGKTDDGRAICGLVEGFTPYFYVKLDRTAASVLSELGLDWSEERRRPAIGWSEPIPVARVRLASPQDVPRLRETLERCGLVCYDADILFRYRFMIDHGLVGMGWLELEGRPVSTSMSKVPALAVSGIRPIDQRRDNAQLRILCVDIECLPMDFKRQMDPRYDPIIIISLAFYPAWRDQTDVVLVARPVSGKGVQGHASEKSMLETFLRIVEEFDPDIITGYNIHSFDLPWLAARLTKYGLRTDLGRCEKPLVIPSGQFAECYATGRVLFDPYMILRRDPTVRLHRYSLANVLQEMLGEEKSDVRTEIPRLWSSDVHRLIEYARQDAVLTLRLVLEKRMIDRFIELSRLSGVLLQDALGGQAVRIESAVLHEFKRRAMLMPTKKLAQAETIKGGAVLEPVVGLHRNVLVLDFASLYPSIIRSFNISPDTLVRDPSQVRCQIAPNGVAFVHKDIYEGVFPTIIDRLLRERWAAKTAMATASGEERRMLDAKQHAIKILCNSFYGYAGYSRARLHVAEVANAITAYGRENINRTKEIVEKEFGVRVLYADTDSLFIESRLDDLDAVHELGKRISQAVSARTGLQFEFEKIYSSFLILTKKRYVGLIAERGEGGWRDGGIDMRGIETVRRDWCKLVTETMQGVLEAILRESDVEAAVSNVKRVIAQLREGTVPLEKLTIVKGLTKALNTYDGLLPHVQLARKLASRSPSTAPRVGERIGYVIVRGSGRLSERAEDPTYVKENKLPIDVDYYINSQLLPPIERIFAALGIEKAELLGAGRQTSLANPGFSSGSINEAVCISCGRMWRRLPLRGLCDCGGQINLGL